jgi:Bacterial cellulose synthase subunit
VTRAATLALGLVVAAPAAAEEPAPPVRVLDVGPTEAQRESGAAVLELPFLARADEELAGARVRVAFAPGGTSEVAGVEVLVNDERVGVLAAGGARPGAPRELEVDADLLAPRNLLALRLVDAQGRSVARRGAWGAVASIRLALTATGAPLPNDLALLPLPFVDRGFDTSARVALVVAGEPTPERIRLAAVVAGWLALDAPIPVSFTAKAGALPDERAVVLVDGAAEAARLGLAVPDGPAVRMADHPAHPGSNVKLLVVAGRSLAELRSAVESLAARTERLVGEEVRLAPAGPQAPAAPYSAPRWVPSGRAVPFAEYPQGGVPAHEGSTSATLSVRFRVAPDLSIWPSEFVVLDLVWSERLPAGVAAPRLDVEMNGYFLATLPGPDGPGEATRRSRLRIPREHMRGFNELLVHVRYPDAPGSSPAGEQPRVAIGGDSVLHLEGLSHFASLPDVALFAYDGFPFTRVPDLGETVVVVPDRPTPVEVAAVLTIAAQLAQVTGRAGTRAAFASAGEVTSADLAGKDVLVVGGAEDNALLARWRPLLPLAVERGRVRVRQPAGGRTLLELTGGLGPLLDRRRAEAVLGTAGEIGAIMGIESPVSAGRSAVVVTGTSPDGPPPFRDLLGYAESRSLVSDDLLLLAGNQRWMFRIGPSFGRGQLDAWTHLRWFLANHWLLLMPVLVVGVLVLAREVRQMVAERMRARLALSEEPP